MDNNVNIYVFYYTTQSEFKRLGSRLQATIEVKRI